MIPQKTGYYWAIDKGKKYLCFYDAGSKFFRFFSSRALYTLEELLSTKTKFYEVEEPKIDSTSKNVS